MNKFNTILESYYLTDKKFTVGTKSADKLFKKATNFEEFLVLLGTELRNKGWSDQEISEFTSNWTQEESDE
jgi:hypothetical protein